MALVRTYVRSVESVGNINTTAVLASSSENIIYFIYVVHAGKLYMLYVHADMFNVMLRIFTFQN